MIHLQGHSALITGSTKGVGRSIAESFAQAGADVIIHGRRPGPDAATVLDRCRSLGVRAEFLEADLMDPTRSNIDTLFERAVELFPELDIVVNNAGTYIDKPFLDMDLETYNSTLQLNVTSPYFLTQRFAQYWIGKRIHGRVLMIGSINGRLAEPLHTCYDLSKGALEMMVKSLCVTLAPLGIRVNGLAPGLVRTPLTSIIDRDDRFSRWMSLHTPNGQVPHSDVCGGGAVYLVSDFAEHVHGQMLLVDGGMSVWQQPDMPEEWK